MFTIFIEFTVIQRASLRVCVRAPLFQARFAMGLDCCTKLSYRVFIQELLLPWHERHI